MSQFGDFWNGTPPETQMQGYTPWIKAPSYDFSSKLYDYLSGMIGAPAPHWGGFGKLESLGQKKNPFANDLTSFASQYMNLGMPSVFGQAVGGIGRFANPTWMNPTARLQMGGAPDYFGSSQIPTTYGGMMGGQASSPAASGAPSFGAMGMMNPFVNIPQKGAGGFKSSGFNPGDAYVLNQMSGG